VKVQLVNNDHKVDCYNINTTPIVTSKRFETCALLVRTYESHKYINRWNTDWNMELHPFQLYNESKAIQIVNNDHKIDCYNINTTSIMTSKRLETCVLLTRTHQSQFQLLPVQTTSFLVIYWAMGETNSCWRRDVLAVDQLNLSKLVLSFPDRTFLFLAPGRCYLTYQKKTTFFIFQCVLRVKYFNLHYVFAMICYKFDCIFYNKQVTDAQHESTSNPIQKLTNPTNTTTDNNHLPPPPTQHNQTFKRLESKTNSQTGQTSSSLSPPLSTFITIIKQSTCAYLSQYARPREERYG
jgi:hypothetical protein